MHENMEYRSFITLTYAQGAISNFLLLKAYTSICIYKLITILRRKMNISDYLNVISILKWKAEKKKNV